MATSSKGMAAGLDDSRIVSEPLYSLSHLATVAVALPMLNTFCLETLDKAFSKIKAENSAAPDEGGEEHLDISCNKAKKKLKLLPPLLRKKVLQVAHSLQWVKNAWIFSNSSLCKYKDIKCFFHWKSHGIIDTIKIAQQLVWDQSINVKKRFEIACKYFLDESVIMLWKKMEASGKTKCFKASNNIFVRFWVRWLQEGSRIPWKQAAGEYLELPRPNSQRNQTNYKYFFSSLPPEVRERFLTPLQNSSETFDLLSCFYKMTKDEQEKILKESLLTVFLNYLDWPLQGLFLETFEKLRDFIEDNRFCHVLTYLINLIEEERGDFDYRELLKELWNISPIHLRKAGIKDGHLQEKINLYIDETESKENADDNECASSKRKVRSNRNRKSKRMRNDEKL